MNIDLGYTKANIRRILSHAAVVASAAVITFLLEELKVADFGESTALIVGGLSFVLKTALEFIRK